MRSTSPLMVSLTTGQPKVSRRRCSAQAREREIACAIAPAPTERLASEWPRQYSQTMHLHRGLHSRCAGTMLGPFSLPGTEPQYERSLPFRFSYLALDLRIVVDSGRVQGHVTHTIERVAKGATELNL